MLAKAGFQVPLSLCISTEAYSAFVAEHGLAERIQLEFNRKNFDDMRWEEIWDMALRIRNLFLTLPMPADLEKSLAQLFKNTFRMFLLPFVLQHRMRMRNLLHLPVYMSLISISKVQQPFLIILNWSGHLSGLMQHCFIVRNLDWMRSKALWLSSFRKLSMAEVPAYSLPAVPTDENKSAIEGVHGLNQALVEGLIEPDRWFVSRNDGKIEYMPVSRTQYMTKSKPGQSLSLCRRTCKMNHRFVKKRSNTYLIPDWPWRILQCTPGY